jgi:hypothetical protein
MNSASAVLRRPLLLVAAVALVATVIALAVGAPDANANFINF